MGHFCQFSQIKPRLPYSLVEILCTHLLSDMFNLLEIAKQDGSNFQKRLTARNQ